jgi:hypothetical protein
VAITVFHQVLLWDNSAHAEQARQVARLTNDGRAITALLSPPLPAWCDSVLGDSRLAIRSVGRRPSRWRR